MRQNEIFQKLFPSTSETKLNYSISEKAHEIKQNEGFEIEKVYQITKHSNRERKGNMRKNKMDNYELTASVHTLQIKSDMKANKEKDEFKEIESALSQKFIVEDDKGTDIIMNPNKLEDDIFKFDEFEKKFDYVMDILDLKEYGIVRADFRLDSYESNHYREFSKLNRYLISLFMIQYNVQNRYITYDALTMNQLSFCIKNKRFELENYDREEKNRITGNTKEIATSRLEERSKANGENWKNLGILKNLFTKDWFDRWDKVIKQENIEKVWESYNDVLEKIYKENRNTAPCEPCRFRTLTDFLLYYQDFIFSSKQMVDLLGRFEEVQNPKRRAKDFKYDYRIEYISNSDLQKAVKEIKRATREYFKPVENKNGKKATHTPTF